MSAAELCSVVCRVHVASASNKFWKIFTRIWLINSLYKLIMKKYLLFLLSITIKYNIFRIFIRIFLDKLFNGFVSYQFIKFTFGTIINILN